ncbi:MAG: thioesterase family protein [Sulfobacillus thermotolerans]|nr:thioesterase family protein [Sulfobacillus thermotolerans]
MTTWTTCLRWAECDVAGIIYHAHLFDWFSEARIHWLRVHNMDYYKILRPLGLELLVRHAEADFIHAMRPGDRCDVHASLTGLTPTRATFTYQVTSQGQETSRGITEHIFVLNGHAARLDRSLPEYYGSLQQLLP